MDYRVLGIPLSTVEQQDAKRENMVKTLIEKFEKHQRKESYIKDLSQTQKINKFSKKSQQLIADMKNTEIFELCENSSKQQCLECNTYWEIGIIYFSCGRNMKSSHSPRRTAVAVPNTDLLNDKECTTKRKQMLKKSSQKKHGNHPTILSRLYATETYKTSLSLIGCKEKHIMRNAS